MELKCIMSAIDSINKMPIITEKKFSQEKENVLYFSICMLIDNDFRWKLSHRPWTWLFFSLLKRIFHFYSWITLSCFSQKNLQSIYFFLHSFVERNLTNSNETGERERETVSTVCERDVSWAKCHFHRLFIAEARANESPTKNLMRARKIWRWLEKRKVTSVSNLCEFSNK